MLDSKGSEFAHGYTYSGHPVACAVVLKNIQILRTEQIIENARDNTMDYFQSKISALREHPLVGEARGKGFLGGLELVADKDSKQKFDTDSSAGVVCREKCLKNGLVMRSVRDIMQMCPPLIIIREQIDEFYQRAWESLNQSLVSLKKSA